MDAEHLRNVRQLDCIACGKPAGSMLGLEMNAHHLLRTGERGMGMRSPDKYAIPLHHSCHMELHHNGDEDGFLAERGIDGRAVAAALWAARGDLEAMRRVIFRAIQEASLKVVGAEGIEPS